MAEKDFSHKTNAQIRSWFEDKGDGEPREVILTLTETAASDDLPSFNSTYISLISCLEKMGVEIVRRYPDIKAIKVLGANSQIAQAISHSRVRGVNFEQFRFAVAE